MDKVKKRWGDRPDATLVRDIDELHWFMPYLYPNRTDNEAFINEELDLTALEAYLAKKNEGLTVDKYTLMQAIGTAVVRVVTQRPKMNRFVKGHRLYQRNDISLAFVIKKQFADEAHEALAFLKFGPETTMDSLHERMIQEIHTCRSSQADNSTEKIGIFTKLPRWVMRIAMKVLMLLDYYGRVPYDLIKADPGQATVFFTNLGSIKLKAAYHHLANWGTNSIFMVLGEKQMKPVFHAALSISMASVGCFNKAEPFPLRTTVVAGHPILISIPSKRLSASKRHAAFTMSSGRCPKICTYNVPSSENRVSASSKSV